MEAHHDDIVRWFELVQWQQGNWVPEIVLVLAKGPAHFTDLCSTIRTLDTDRWWFSRRSQLSNSQLSRTLRAMQRDELVLRHEDRSGVPITVTYELSPLLINFLLTGPIKPAADWLRQHNEPMEQIRDKHRQRRDEHHRPDDEARTLRW